MAKATTARAAAILLDQSSGTLRTPLERLLTLDQTALTEQLSKLLSWSNFGIHLTQPWRVVLAGRPNVGKSTLINELLGYTRSIVFDQPGTTRDVVTGGTAFEGWPFQLADTAGIRTTDDELEHAGIQRARRTVESANLVCLLLDMSRPPTLEDRELLDEFTLSPGPQNKPPTIIIAHKADLPYQWSSSLPDNALPEAALPVSSTTRTGVEELITQIVKTLIPEIPEPRTAIPISQRQVSWLDEALRAATDGKVTQAVEAIEQCLAGAPFADTKRAD